MASSSIDPLAQVVALLQPTAPFSKSVSGAGRWLVRRSEAGRPYYCAVIEGGCRLEVDGQKPLLLHQEDFCLIPSAYDFTMSSLLPATPEDLVTFPVALPDGELRVGPLDGPPDVRLLMGYCVFGSPDVALLLSLLPEFVLVRGEKRLSTLVELVGEESRNRRPARDVVLAHLLEVLLIEALRCPRDSATSSGLLRGLADERLAAVLRRIHESPTLPWTAASLAKEAALSRSVFFQRFRRAVGVAPMEYVLAWRMALAKNLLQRKEGNVAQVAAQVGYSSPSTFSVAFTRHVGVPPARYAREGGGALADVADRLKQT